MPNYAITPVLNMAFLDTLGNKASGGKIRTYKNDDRSVSKAAYQDPGGISPYPSDIISTYIPLNDFGETPGLIYLADDEPYYMEVYDKDGGLIDYYENVTPQGGGGSPVTTVIPITNHILNGQFRFFDTATYTTFLANDDLEFANKWHFKKSNATATDALKILPFPMGGVAGVPANPDYYFEYSCTVAGTGETFKDIGNQIPDVTSFQEEQVSFSFVAKSPSSSPVELVFVQNFGSGGTPSATVRTNVATFNLTNTWARYTASFTVPSVGGMIRGTNGDDYVMPTLVMPLNTVGTVQATNVQLERGALANAYQYRTYDVEAALLGVNDDSTGDTKFTLKKMAKKGWIIVDDGTIGSAASGATTRASADTRALYTLLWNNFEDSFAPVTGGRGANAAADFNANKPIQVLYSVGRALAAAHIGNSILDKPPGFYEGERLHTLTKAELAPHRHQYTKTIHPYTAAAGGTPNTVNQPETDFTEDGAADGIAGDAHNNMQPTLFLNLMIKL